MIFLFHDKAGDSTLLLQGDAFKHMIKARRQTVGDIIMLKKADDTMNYFYSIESSSKKEAHLQLVSTEQAPTQEIPYLHLGWCVIDAKSIEKVLPSLCEMGLSEISFIYANRSQKNFKLDIHRLERIITNSMQQSGRFHTLKLHEEIGLSQFLQNNQNCVVLDFCEQTFSDNESFSSVLLGPEGGFDEQEKELLSTLTVRRLNTPLVLKSESAALAVTAKLLL